MSEVISHIFGNGGGRTDVHRNTYRILCTIAGVLSPAFGAVYLFIHPEAYDPIWARLVLTAVSISLLGLSYTSTWVKRNFIQLVHLFFYLLTVFFVGITALNNFSPDYTLGMMFAITAIGIAFSLGLRRVAPLTHYLSFTVLITVPTLLFHPDREVSSAIVSISVSSIALVTYVVARAKIQAEEAVKASEQRYQTLMNAANDAIFIAAPHSGRLIYANEKAQELTGRPLEELRQMHYADLFPDDEREHYTKLFEEHIFEGAPMTGDLYIQPSRSQPVPVDISASLIDLGDKKLIQGIFRDATARHHYEEQLIQAKDRAEEMLRLKTSFLNNMSHEIRTPLTSILGYAEVLSEEVEEMHQDFAHTITKSAKRLQKTLNSVLDLARLESGEASLEPEQLDVSGEVRDAVTLLKPLADQKDLFLNTDLKVPQIYARLDATCLSRIINNLVGNAIKFTEEGGVTVEVDGDPQHVYLRVRDTGIGITDDFLKHLFDEFRQESTGLARSHEGSGLGLAITKRLVDLMEGTIDVDSTKGVGTVFSVSFPRTGPTSNGSAAQTSFDEPENASENASLPSKKILVVEDNIDTQNLVKHMLGAYYQVETTDQPDLAFEMAKRSSFDTLLLDINLGDAQDGIDLLHHLREIPGYRKTPAVALTAYTMPGDRERFLEAGFDHYLGKPFTKQQLMDVVESTLPSLQPETSA